MNMKYLFRDLRADEIDVRVSRINESGCALLLYKDARCDMNILDEAVGSMNWRREHTRDNANCIVSLWDSEKKQWISKEDTGTESNTEKEKGLASDSFKRACFNWGIGRELYTAPFIYIPYKYNGKLTGLVNISDAGNKRYVTKDRFEVTDIKIKNKVITALTIFNTTQKVVAFRYLQESDAK